MSLEYYIKEDHKDWEQIAVLDESESYEVDITEIYYIPSEGTFALATATGCSCWDGDYETEEFTTLKALESSMVKDDRQYNPSFKGAAELMLQAKAWLAYNLH